MKTIAAIALGAALLSAVSVADWTAIGPDGGYVQALGIDPQRPAVLYAIPYEYPDTCRVFRTTNAGASWSVTGSFPQLDASMLIVAPGESAVLYATARGQALYRSTDAGASWTEHLFPEPATDFDADPHTAGRLYASGYVVGDYERPAVSISTDRGDSWSQSILSDDTGYAYCSDCDPSRPGVVYTGCDRGLVYRTTDGGSHWEPRNSGLPADEIILGISVSPADTNVVIAAGVYGLHRTTDAGRSWNLVPGLGYVFRVQFSPANGAVGYALWYDTTAMFAVTTDFGASWTTQPYDPVLAKVSNFLPDPGSAAGVYLSSTAGVFKTTDRGVSWHPSNAGMRIAHISTLAAAPWNRRNVYLEAYENGVFKTSSCGDTWTRCEDFLSCGNICGIGVGPGSGTDVLWALEGSG